MCGTFKTRGMSPGQFPKPLKPRKKSKTTDNDDFFVRTVNQVSAQLFHGSPATQNAAVSVLGDLALPDNNVSKLIVSAKTASGNPAQGMSQDVCRLLIHSKKLATMNK